MVRVFFILFSSTLFASMQFFPGDREAMIVDLEDDVSLMTWNIYGLPNDLTAIRPWEERIDGIANTILQANANIVVLEECFETGLSLGLYERLRSEYAYIYLDIGENKMPRTSGLALFSKCPIGEFRFTAHRDLLDLSRNARMGTIDFFILGKDSAPLARITASHFLGSANYEWRVGMIDDGRRLSYEEIRREEALSALQQGIEKSIPHYVCGDLNVDRRSFEFAASPLNANVNPSIIDKMSSTMQQIPTNTDFWKVVKGFSEAYPFLAERQILQLARRYQTIYQEVLKERLAQAPWDQALSKFDPSFFSTLEEVFDLISDDGKRMWEYFKKSSLDSILKEERIWQQNGNTGQFPNVSIGRVIEVSALPIEEALDFVIGTNVYAQISSIEILQGYDYGSNENTFSDHHLIKAKIRVR